MSKVILSAAVSLDGFVANLRDTPGPIFDWYENGDVAFNGGDPERVFHVSQQTADYLDRMWGRIGAAVIGRHLFNITNGWEGRPAAGDAVFVVTHEPPTTWPFPDAPFTFVTDGIESAIAQAKQFAGDRDVSLTGGDLAGQALAAGLVDEIQLDLAPFILGTGKRFFGDYTGPIVGFGDPEIVQGTSVTHLHYTRA